MSAAVTLSRFLTVDQVGQALQISRRTVERLIADEGLPVVTLGRPGRSVRVDVSELERWLQSDAPARAHAGDQR